MDGMNKRFMSDPAAFLRTTAIFEAGMFGANPPAQGLATLDLRPYGAAVRLDSFAQRGKAAGAHSHQILAHWLPWQSRGTAEIQLDNGANYFFTSQLAGCQIRIIPGAPRGTGRTNHPIVRHIAGDRLDPRGDVTGTLWRNQQAAHNVTAPVFARSRALSSTGIGARGYNGEGVNVVGFVSWMRWKFWAQQIDFDNSTVLRCWEIT
jgi:hypothetical protein